MFGNRIGAGLRALAILLGAALGLAAGVPQQKKPTAEGLPLEPTRNVELTTDEGTWISIDVSPDGKSLLFDLLGDLYTVPIEGGEATPISTGMAFESQPRFSPDGAHIVFLSDRGGAENVWIARAGGSEPRQLTADEDSHFASPAWTPDGDYVIVSRTTWGLGTYELWMYHRDGGKGIQITKAKPTPDTPRRDRLNALGVAPSPDGRYLYYARKTGGFEYNLIFPQWQIARRDRTSGDEDVLTRMQGSAFRPVLSPDGSLLVYGTRFDAETGLHIRDLRTGDDRWLAYPVTRDDQEAIFSRDLLPGYAFLPDGKEIVLSYGGKIHRVEVATGTSRSVPFSAKVALDLGPRLDFPRRVEEGPVRARIIQDPSLSPDGRRLAFSALTRLYVMELEGSGAPRRLTASAAREFQPAWSPDGAWVAYVTWSSGEGGHVWRTRSDGTAAPERLTRSPAFYSDPVWSPEGSRIVVLRASAYDRAYAPVDFGQPAGMDLVSLPAEGGEADLILPARGHGKPHFATEPDRIYVYSAGPGEAHGLVSVRLDGRDRREHLRVTGPGSSFAEEPVPAEDVRIRPDGRWALANVANQLYLLAVPQPGGEAPSVDVSDPAVPVRRLTDVGADYFAWSPDGETIGWAIGASFFRRPFASITFPPAREEDEESAEDKESVLEENAEGVARTDVLIEAPRHRPRGRILLRGARLITLRGDEVIEDGEILLEDNRIVALGARGSLATPAAARVFDVSGLTMAPGFVDTHAHWFEIRRGILDTSNWSFLANLAYGVTSGLDVQTGTNDMFAYQDLVDVGEILGPRADSTGPGVFSENRFSSLAEVRGVLARYKEHYRTRNLKAYLVGNRRQRQLVALAARELEMMPTTEGGLDLELDLTHAVDGFSGNEHSLPIVPLYRDVVEVFARSGIGYTPTLLVAYGGPFAENAFYTTREVHDDPKLRRFLPHHLIDQKTQRRPWFRETEHVYPRIAAQAAKIVRAGGRVGVGSHGQLQGLGFHWEMWALASGGFTPMEVLRAATLHGADIIGVSQDLGSLEPGKLADLVLFEKNPLDDIHHTETLKYVIKNGELFEAETLRQIWPEEKPGPDPGFSERVPEPHPADQPRSLPRRSEGRR